MLPLSGDKTREPFLRTPADEDTAVFSPGGRWIAYNSDESGNREVYVKAFPFDASGIHMVWRSGGWQAMWQGKRFLVIVPEHHPSAVTVEVNWLASRQK